MVLTPFLTNLNISHLSALSMASYPNHYYTLLTYDSYSSETISFALIAGKIIYLLINKYLK